VHSIEEQDMKAVEQLNTAFQNILQELEKVIVGQKPVIEEILISVFAQGHSLLVGVPGLAKTLLINTLADALSLSFNRIQFTPDLMPSDITGTDVIQENKETGDREFKFLKGPLFANVLLADEINRTPPKTQAALLEAMQEQQVTIGGKRHLLGHPFFVLATQNPIEQEGTYPLPEAQLDRFMFNILVDYPTEDEELRIVQQTTAANRPQIKEVLTGPQIIELQEIVRKVPIADHVIRYAMQFTRLTRQEKGPVPDFVKEYVSWGAGPRASQYLVLGAKAHAVLHGRHFATTEDILRVAAPVLRHRIITNFSAEAEGIKPDDIVVQLSEVISRDFATQHPTPETEPLSRNRP